MELIQLKIRQLDLAQRQPNGSTELGVGMRWMLEQAQFLTDLADYTLRNARAQPEQH
jgi:hypothetical protein